jgi:hypothetical protein
MTNVPTGSMQRGISLLAISSLKDHNSPGSKKSVASTLLSQENEEAQHGQHTGFLFAGKTSADA